MTNEKRHEVGDAHAEVEESMRSRLDDLGELVSIANGDQPTATTATALGIDVDDPQDSAMQRLDEYPSWARCWPPGKSRALPWRPSRAPCGTKHGSRVPLRRSQRPRERLQGIGEG